VNAEPDDDTLGASSEVGQVPIDLETVISAESDVMHHDP